MTAAEYRWFHGSNIAVIATGLAYGWLRYFVQVEGDYGPMAHPMQAHLQHAHILLAPLLVAIIGYFVHGHFMPRQQSRGSSGLKTGFMLAGCAAPMIVSGYAVQVAVQEQTRTIAVWLHVATSILWIIASVLHVITHARRRRAVNAPDSTG